jgi:AraC-like DNA-binding protein
VLCLIKTHKYLSYVRIEKAKEFLKEDVSVTEVFFAVGFDSLSSLTGLFKRAVVQTPLAYELQRHHLKAETAKAPLKFIPHCYAARKNKSK